MDTINKHSFVLRRASNLTCFKILASRIYFFYFELKPESGMREDAVHRAVTTDISIHMHVEKCQCPHMAPIFFTGFHHSLQSCSSMLSCARALHVLLGHIA